MVARSPVRSVLNRRLGLDDADPSAPDAQTDTPAPPEQPANTFTTQPVAKATTTPEPPPAPELSGWQSVQGGNLDRAWTDFATMKYGGAGSAGFANMPTGGLGQAVNEFNTATGAHATMIPGPSGDLIDFGDGRGPVDVKTAGGQLWNARLGGNNGAGGGAAGGAGAPGVGAGGAGGAYGSSQSTSGGVSPFNQSVRDLLMKQLGLLSQPVNANDPSIAPEMAAQNAVLERTRQERRAASAERAAANGLLGGGQSSGSFDADIASGYEDKGQQLTGIQASLFGREIQSRRDKVAQLLSMAMQSGDAESARSLQYEMAQMDDQIKRLGLSQQQSQFNDSFGLNAGQFQYQKDRDLALAGLG